MLTVDELVDDCRSLLGHPDIEHVVAGYLSQLLRDRYDEVVRLLDEGTETEVLHRALDLTVTKVVLPPQHRLPPHHHAMWAVVGVVVGREDNTFYRHDGERLEVTAGASYEQGQVGVLDASVIHSVHNPLTTHTVSLHVYGGDLP